MKLKAPECSSAGELCTTTLWPTQKGIISRWIMHHHVVTYTKGYHQQVNYAPPRCDLHKRVSSAGELCTTTLWPTQKGIISRWIMHHHVVTYTKGYHQQVNYAPPRCDLHKRVSSAGELCTTTLWPTQKGIISRWIMHHHVVTYTKGYHQQVNYAPPRCDLHKRVSSAGELCTTTLWPTQKGIISRWIMHHHVVTYTKGYHQQELPQVSFFGHNKTFDTTNTYTSFVVTKVCLPQQKFGRDNLKKPKLSQQNFCHDKHVQVFCRDKSMLATTEIWSWQLKKNKTVTTKLLTRQTRTGLLSWQKYACHNRNLVVTIKKNKKTVTTKVFKKSQQKFCCNKHTFVATKVSLSRQSFCHTKLLLGQIFVGTKVLSQ